MAATKKAQSGDNGDEMMFSAIEINPIQTQTVAFPVRGTRPIILNRMAEKARQQLLIGGGRKTVAERAANLKHDPLEEYRSAAYTLRPGEGTGRTTLGVPSSFFKAAMMQAAIDLPGAARTTIGRLVWVEGDMTDLFGVPQMFTAITRNADRNKTPDVKTRAIVPEWAVVVVVTFAVPLLNTRSIANLLAAAGKICGVGDYRPERGKGTYGQFVLTNPDDDDDYVRILATGTKEAQDAALSNPLFYNRETEDLYHWYEGEVERTGRTGQRKAKVGATNGIV